MQDLFGRDIEQVAIERIKTFCPEEGYYVAFSGGKDSIVVLDLVRRAGVKHDTHFNRTSVDPPELLKFIKRHYPDVEQHKPEKTMFQLIVHNLNPPTRLSRYCCRILKERGGAWRTVITGIRGEESPKRKKRALEYMMYNMVEFCQVENSHKKFVHPIIDWKEKNIWEYIREHALPYCNLYDEGWKRIGCIGCPMSSKVSREGVRWPNVKKAYLHSFGKMLEARKEKKLATTWQTPEEVWNWWVQENRKPDPNQECFIFD